ncbi:phage tail tape measure protein [Streptomyces sp. MBT42]|nr:phage tail tape measure protein [Streptomyces sp. MBT42]
MSNVRSRDRRHQARRWQQLARLPWKPGRPPVSRRPKRPARRMLLARAGVEGPPTSSAAPQGVPGLAAAGQVDLTRPPSVLRQAMNTFGLAGKDVTHISPTLLAAGANKSRAAEVHGLSMSLPHWGGCSPTRRPVHRGTPSATWPAFADTRVIGSDAGTPSRSCSALGAAVQGKPRSMMAEIGFSAYDSKGEFVGLNELAGG